MNTILQSYWYPMMFLINLKSFFLKFTGNNPNPKENIQRVEIMDMDKHFKKLKNSNDTFESSFYDAIAKVVGQRLFLCWGI